MTSLRWVGPYPMSLSLLAAILLASCAWWLYRREVRDIVWGPARWLLPTLRAGAILLIVLTLAEPIVETRRSEGNPGRVRFLLDDSQSMSLVDRGTNPAGESPATASPATVSPAMESPATESSRLERAATQLLNPTTGVLKQLSEHFELSVECFGSERSVGAEQFAEPLSLWSSTVARAEPLPASPSLWLPTEWGERSAIGDILSSLSAVRGGADSKDNSVHQAIVLITDGQSNSGRSPLSVVEEQWPGDTPIFVVGCGPTREPDDIALVDWELPERVYRTDTLSGVLVVKDRLPSNSRWRAEILHAGQVVWQAEFAKESSERREIPFSFPVAPAFEAELSQHSRDTTYATLPLPLEARITTNASDSNLNNNRRQALVDVASQKSRLLLVDGRSRWETRYLRNLFDRDPAWEIDTILATSEEASPQASATLATHRTALPSSRDELFEYNLIILGDAPAEMWPANRLEWLSEFVERGGGLIFIDGGRKHLRDPAYEPLNALLPIRWTDAASQSVAGASEMGSALSEVGQRLTALEIMPGQREGNAELWTQLPKLRWVSAVEPLPGSEVLLQASSGAQGQALLVTRRFGGGRVLFFATDETWRWRYKVADTVHQRIWNQLARWAMRVPLNVQGEFVSLDTGASTVAQGETVEVRCTLRELDGTLASDKSVTAILRRADQIVARVPLVPQPEIPGAYNCELRNLPPGEYQLQVEAAGYPQQALAVESRFKVQAADSRELERIAQDEALLRQLATSTGGQYLAESEIGQLVELLEPHRQGRILQSATLIWQSYWWFGAAMVLLSVEWILRKRNGLV